MKLFGNNSRRRTRTTLLIFSVLFVLILTGCGAVTQGTWPSVSSEGDIAYIAFRNSVTALDVANASIKWEYTSDATTEFYSAPQFYNDRLYFVDYGRSGGLISLQGLIVSFYGLENIESAQPQLIWDQPATEAVSGRVVGEGVVYDNVYYVGTSDNHVVAVDLESGTEKWEILTENAVWAQPLLHNDILYVASMDRNLYALNPQTGEEIWKTTLEGAIASTPIVNEAGDALIFGDFSGEIVSVDIASQSINWRLKAEDWIWASPAREGNIAYFVDASGNVYDVDIDTGEFVNVRQNAVKGGSNGNPLIVDDKLIVISTEKSDNLEVGHLTALPLDGGDPVWTYSSQDGGFNTSPELIGDTILLPFSNNDYELQIVGLDPNTGDVTYSYTPE